jgi:neurofibromin 1
MVKRKLVHQEKVRRARRGVSAQSALTAPSLLVVNAATNSVIETNTITALNELIPSLGSPPQDITIGKLQPLSHIKPEYARFQQFMVKNAGRSVESILSARIIYDGGESKDGMPVICVILRNIIGKLIDTDLFLYCLLKVSSPKA